ncbi:MAG: hypothetical protein N2235_10625 [Fischerella sp.]|nr:hypothetical protein [Fischerella sp.]
MHPLCPDLSSLSDEELHKKHGELMQRLSFAYGQGGTDMYQQLSMLISDYRAEIQRRNQKHLEEMQKQIEARNKALKK